ncbi:MAG: ABC transporter permease [Chloroflexi bacterium]|nr:ABC transporter permease [Chloroflexota bacterium]
MASYIARRLIIMIPTVLIISFISFGIIVLPPGDYLESLVASLEAQGERADQDYIAFLRRSYGLDQPFIVQYWRWFSNMFRGDFGYSFEFRREVSDLIGERMLLTVVISITTILLTTAIAWPIALFSATHKYSFFDYVATFFGFIGVSTPSFLIALVFMFLMGRYFGVSAGGLFSPQYMDAAWSWARVKDLLAHLWVPLFILATGSTAGSIRTIRANMLDELGKPYVITARAKGLTELKVILKYPFRVALNPFFSSVGWMLPGIISGSTILSTVLSLPTAGPLLLRALQTQDMYLAGSFIFLQTILTVIGTLLSDLALAWSDPRVRYGKAGS